MRGNGVVTLAWLVCIGLSAHRDMAKQPSDAKGLPSPQPMVSTTMVYSLITVVAQFAAPLAGVLAVGYAVTLLMVPGVLPQSPIAAAANAVGGKIGNTPTSKTGHPVP